jgi:hypothetical protein
VKSDETSCKNATTRDFRPAPASEPVDLALARDPNRSRGTGMKADKIAIDTQGEALQRQASRITRWHLGALGITAAFCVLATFIMTHLAQTAVSGETELNLLVIACGLFVMTCAICSLEFALLLLL